MSVGEDGEKGRRGERGGERGRIVEGEQRPERELGMKKRRGCACMPLT